PVEGISQQLLLDEEQVLQIVAAYLPYGTVNKNQLAEWMTKDGSWGGTKRRRMTRDKWDDLHNLRQFRRHVRLTSNTVFNMGYIRRSNTQDT
ncbi:uncharacterized protein BYT42DRAFT_482000, partial [Radiomyces spectabilis]|uniref:uncharacterized protein n=1 Tax=Radiomyces spectabilis TaxID=64574 RepID=UPI00221E3E61